MFNSRADINKLDSSRHSILLIISLYESMDFLLKRIINKILKK
jgi:hypothetical protein